VLLLLYVIIIIINIPDIFNYSPFEDYILEKSILDFHFRYI